MQAVIFDMDGVLVDSERVCLEAFRYAGEKNGVADAERMAVLGLGLTDPAWEALFYAEFGNGEEALALLRDTEAYIARFYSANPVPPKKGLRRVLPALRAAGYRLAVASSSPRETVYYRLEGAGVRDAFDVIVTGDMLRHSKPHPAIYLEAARQLGCDPRDCYAVEDAPSGLRSATAAGCKTIFIPDLWRPETEEPGLYVARLADLDALGNYLGLQ